MGVKGGMLLGVDAAAAAPAVDWSLLFNGSTGYVDSASAPVTTGPYTLATWAKTSDLVDNQTVLALSIPGSTATHVRLLATAGGTWRLNTIDSGGSSGAVDSGGISSGAWTHLAATRGVGIMGWEFFVGGVSQGTLPNAAMGTPTVLSLGVLHFSIDLQYFNGRIAETAVFPSILSGADIASLAAGTLDPSARSPVLFWDMEEGSGTTLTDSSGNSNTGTLHGGVSWSSDHP